MKIIRLAVLAALLSAGGAFLVGSYRSSARKARRAATNATRVKERVVLCALEAFKVDAGVFPGGGNAAIAAALRGNSPSKRVYLPPLRDGFDAAGNLVDAWGTPYRFEPAADGKMLVRSAGPDRRHSTADDVTRDFVRRP